MKDNNKVINLKEIQSRIKKLDDEQQSQQEALSEISKAVNKGKSELTEYDFLLYLINELIGMNKTLSNTMSNASKTISLLSDENEDLHKRVNHLTEHVMGLYKDVEEINHEGEI